MGKRLDLHALLKILLGSDNVYFQPPSTCKMKYPCIVYTRYYGKTLFANDNPYLIGVGYQVTIIVEDPDSEIPAKVAKLPMCLFNRKFTADNLNHDIYNLYY